MCDCCNFNKRNDKEGTAKITEVFGNEIFINRDSNLGIVFGADDIPDYISINYCFNCGRKLRNEV